MCPMRDSDPKGEALSTPYKHPPLAIGFAGPLDPLGKGLLIRPYRPSSPPQDVAPCATLMT